MSSSGKKQKRGSVIGTRVVVPSAQHDGRLYPGVIMSAKTEGLVTISTLFCWLFLFKDRRKNAFSTNAQSRFASVAVDGDLGPSRLAHHTWRCPCTSVVPEATHDASRGHLDGSCVSSKSPSRVRDRYQGDAGRNGREYVVFPRRGLWPPLYLISFLWLPVPTPSKNHM